jgi:hypothetical protein
MEYLTDLRWEDLTGLDVHHSSRVLEHLAWLWTRVLRITAARRARWDSTVLRRW